MNVNQKFQNTNTQEDLMDKKIKSKELINKRHSKRKIKNEIYQNNLVGCQKPIYKHKNY